ncbi:MAG: MFS transporter [candidate division WOR-3 bacterium]
MEIFTISFVVFTIMSGFSILFPILPFWATNLGATPFEVGLVFSAYPLAQFIFAPIWGKISDRLGYKFGISVGALGFGLTSLLIPIYPSVIYLIIIRFLGGIISSAALPSTSAYIGAISSERVSTRNFGIYGAAIGLGIVVGPFIGGFASNYGTTIPFIISGIFGFLAFLVSILALKNVKGNISFGVKAKGLKTDKKILVLFAFVIMVIMVNFEVILALLIKDKFSLGSREVGYLLGFSGLVGAIVQGNAGRITKITGEWGAIFLGFMASAAISPLIPLAPSFKVLSLLVVLIVSFSGISQPSMLSLLSKGAENRGEVMGAYQSASSLGRIVGPILGGYLYSLSIKLPFLFASILSLVCLIIWWRVKKLYTKSLTGV